MTQQRTGMAPLTAGIYLILLFASLAYNYNFVLIDYIRPFLVRHAGMTLTDTAWLYIAQGSGVLLASFVVPVPVGRFGTKGGAVRER